MHNIFRFCIFMASVILWSDSQPLQAAVPQSPANKSSHTNKTKDRYSIGNKALRLNFIFNQRGYAVELECYGESYIPQNHSMAVLEMWASDLAASNTYTAEFLRLYDITGDAYFLRIARLLEKNTKQTMDYDGSLCFSHPGLQREAIRCVTHRGDGVQLWLPWCTAAALDPLFRMEDAYGIDNIKTRADRHSLYSRRLGIVRIPGGRID